MLWFGRQLRTYSKGSTTASFVYDADGLRSSKTVNGTKTTYQYVGDQLFYEDRGNGNKLYYFYDSYGNLTRIYHHNNGNKAAYYVATNAQGDIVALYNASGKKVGAYDYDAWGNQRVFVVTQDSSGANVHTQINPETQYLTHIVNLNPFRYRGYYFDRDLGLYYLQSRYYDSTIGRFINADGYLTTGQGVLSYNMYAYCLNNPVSLLDPTGNCPFISASFHNEQICSYCNPLAYPSNPFLFNEVFQQNTQTQQQMMVPSSPHVSSNVSSNLTEYAAVLNDSYHAMAQASNVITTQSSHHLIISSNPIATNANNYLGYALVGVDAVYGIYNNYHKHETGIKIAWDAIVDVGVNSAGVYISSGIGASVGAAVGSVFPVIGTAGGYAVGFAVGCVVGVIYNSCAQEIIPYLKGEKQ